RGAGTGLGPGAGRGATSRWREAGGSGTVLRRRAVAVRRWRDARGSGTALGLGVVAVALVLTVALAGLGREVAARAAARGAADLAALAAATRLEGPGRDAEAACRAAVELAAGSGE